PVSGSAPQSYVVEAGMFTGARDVVLDTGTTSTSFTASDVSVGTYFVRVRSENAAGTSAPSNEVIVIVTGASDAPTTPAAPAPPIGLAATVTGDVVHFSWAPSPL